MNTLTLSDEEVRLVIWGLGVADDEYSGTSLRWFADSALSLAQRIKVETGLRGIDYGDLADKPQNRRSASSNDSDSMASE